MITPADLKRLLVYPITFHRIFSEVGGGVTAGLLLSQLFYLATNHADEDGWFYHAGKVLMDETTLTRTEFDNARTKLKGKGILYEDLRGVPAQLHWRIDLDCLANLIAGNPQTEVQKRRSTDRRKPAAKNAGNPQSLTDHLTDQNKPVTTDVSDQDFIKQKARLANLTKATAERLASEHRNDDGSLRRVEFERRCFEVAEIARKMQRSAR